MSAYNLCIIKPNKSAFSETFLNEHINRLSGEKKVLYGGAFPLYDHEDKLLIRSKISFLSYLIQKRLLKKKDIAVRTKALASYFKVQKIDVVLAEYGMVGSMVREACELSRVPLVVHFHGADAHHQPTVANYLSHYKEMFAYASSIVAVSLDMVEALVRLGAPREKVHFISCGVDINKFSPVEVSAGKNFLSVGRFVPKKAPLVLVNAFARVLKEIPEARLNMVGDGPLFAQVKSLVQQLGITNSVCLMGVQNQDQVRELFKQSTCFVQHSVTATDSDMEGTPVTILEAGASGLPIVSTKHAGIKQAVLDGVSGFLVDENDVEAMALRMIEVAKMQPEQRRAMGEKGRAHISHNYSIEGQIAKLDVLIKKALKNLDS